MRDFYKTIPLRNIKVEGALHDLLERYSKGLLGNLEEVWKDVGPDNGWKGGDGDAWERGPYYVDGLVPTAFLLNDEKLLEKAEAWVTWSIQSQREDGNFGPASNDDWWPRMVILKAIIQYAEGLDDAVFYKKIENFIDSYLVYFEKNIDAIPLSMWAYVRGGELLSTVLWMYKRTNAEKYIELGRKIHSLSLDWKSFFAAMPFTLSAEYYLPWNAFSEYLERFNLFFSKEPMKHRREYDPFFRIFHQTHGVNIAMGLKYLGYEYVLYNDDEILETIRKGYSSLMEYHGQVTGMFSCDEHLNGTSPSKGTELCTVVELMYSLEEIMRYTGDFSWYDTLERIAFNALPATISDDGCAHQYDQQVNQISCSIDKRGWYNNLDDSNIFGLEPNFGCCTANMHQGLPKFIVSQWVAGEGEWRCLSFFSSSVVLDVNKGIKVSINSDYPFLGHVEVDIESEKTIDRRILFRIPEWCTSKNSSPQLPIENGFYVLDGIPEGKSCLYLDFSMMPDFRTNEHGIYIERGALLFSLPIKHEKRVLVDRGRFSDFEYKPISEWRYALKKQYTGISVADRPIFSKENPPVSLLLDGFYQDDWKIVDNSAGNIDFDSATSKVEKLELIPYGCTDLRITVFPELKD